MTNSTGHRIQIGVKLPEDLIRELDEWLAGKSLPPTRTQVIEQAIRKWLDWDREKDKVIRAAQTRSRDAKELKREPFEEPA